MKKSSALFFLLVCSAYCEHSYYLDASSEGPGIGYEYIWKSFFFHAGSATWMDYRSGTRTGPWYDSNAVFKSKSLFLKLIPYTGIGFNYKANKGIVFQTYLDYFQISKVIFAHESLVSKGIDHGAGYILEYLWDFPKSLTLGIGCVFTKPKLPMGISVDFRLTKVERITVDLYVSPKFTLYLTRPKLFEINK